QAGLGAARRLLRDALEAAEDALGSAGEKVRHMRRQLDEEWSSLEAGREELAAARARVREQLGEAGRTLADLEDRERERIPISLHFPPHEKSIRLAEKVKTSMTLNSRGSLWHAVRTHEGFSASLSDVYD
ncbi:unnamed protein product, partial [Prorocentrum cordatum]